MSLLVFVSVRDVDSASLTDPASRAEEAKTAIADALAWTELESKAQEARDTIMAQTMDRYGYAFDGSWPVPWGVIGSVDDALTAVNKVEAPPWPGNSSTEEDFETRKERLIAATQNENKRSSELRAALEAFQDCAKAPYTQLCNTLRTITSAVEDEGGQKELTQGVKELIRIADSAKNCKDSAWKDRFDKLGSIISDIQTLGARIFPAASDSPPDSDNNEEKG